jgi:APA family basic amino acid/polyamine antiporter
VTSSKNRRVTIGLFSLVCLIIGNMIGSGVYISSSYALGALSDARLVLFAWLIGGLHAMCGAIAYAALARRVRLSGGEYTFLSRFVHPAVGLMAGWISLTAGFVAPVAAAALIMGEYVQGVSEPTTEARLIATGWIVACGFFHCINLRTGSWVNNGIVALKLLGFLIFAGACLWFLARFDATPTETSAWSASQTEEDFLNKLMHPSIWMVIIVQLFFISLSYTGFNASIYIAEEVGSSNGASTDDSEPASEVSQSMILACALVTLIYLGLNALFLACNTSEGIISGGDYFVSDVAYRAGGDWLRWVMRATIVLSSATSVLAMMATGPRVMAQMARDGWLPARLSPSQDTPRMAIVLQGIASAAIVWLATVKELIDYLGLTLTACGALATSTLWIAYREMNRIRPVRWWEHAALLLYTAGAIALLYAAVQIRPTQFWLGVATFAIGGALYAFSRRRR